jgi:hypothetical protein
VTRETRNVPGSRSSAPRRSQTGRRPRRVNADARPSVNRYPSGASRTATLPWTASSNEWCVASGTFPRGGNALATNGISPPTEIRPASGLCGESTPAPALIRSLHVQEGPVSRSPPPGAITRAASWLSEHRTAVPGAATGPGTTGGLTIHHRDLIAYPPPGRVRSGALPPCHTRHAGPRFRARPSDCAPRSRAIPTHQWR